jgi:hypothetical protein
VSDTMVELNHTVRAAGKDVRVPITYEKEGVHFVFTAPLYKLKISRSSKNDAWKEFSETLTRLVEQRLKDRLL